MIEVQYFKATMRTHRFNKNQRVWVRFKYSNHMLIWHKFRGKHRYVSGIINNLHPSVGVIKAAMVEDAFGLRIRGPDYDQYVWR